MSIQSDAAKAHIESLFKAAYPGSPQMYMAEYPFSKLDTGRKWRFDYADFACRCAIEIDGGTFQAKRTGHASGTGLRAWREKNNAAMKAGWRVFHYAPEEIIKTGRKTLSDEPILKVLPWLEKREKQSTIEEAAIAHATWCSCGEEEEKQSKLILVPAKLSGDVSHISLLEAQYPPDSAKGTEKAKKRNLKEEL